jgi:membrane-associated PAP2 superfamily phosphatase
MTAFKSEPAKRPYIGRYLLTQTVLVTVLLACMAYSVLHSDLDLAVSAYFFDAAASTFPWRKQPVVDFIGRYVIWAIPVAGGILAGSAALASYRIHSLQRARWVLWALCVILIATPLLGGQIKQWTASVRPWTLAMFGGSLSLPGAFWAASGEAGGGALPSVHTATALSLYSLYFAGWALDRPRLRWTGLAVAVIAGLFFGGLRIMQGAHLLSQTLWSAAYAWCLCSLLFAPLICRRSPRFTGEPAALFQSKSPG